jgi:cytochrome-b5 reductase
MDYSTYCYVAIAMVVPLLVFRKYFSKLVSGGSSTATSKATLIQKLNLSHNAVLLKFQASQPYNLPVGKHFQLSSVVNDQPVQRSYTPVSTNVEKIQFDLLVKVYKPTERFPKGGAFSQYLDSLSKGDTVDMKGPVGRLEYLGNSMFELFRPSNMAPNVAIQPSNPTTIPLLKRTFKHIGMIAGGTGIAPMWQIIKALAEEKSATVKTGNTVQSVDLLYGNQTIDDILLHSDLSNLQEEGILKVKFAVDRTEDPSWKGFVGLIDTEKIKSSLPNPSDETLILVCGPPMMNKAVKESLAQLGYQWIHVF